MPSAKLALIFVGCLVPVQAWSQSVLRVGIVGDQTGTHDLDSSYAVFAKGLELLARADVAGVLHTGDLVESSLSDQEYEKRFRQAVSLLAKLGKPWHLAPGDHDVNPRRFLPNSPDRSMQKLYFDLYRKYEPALSTGLFHSFDIDGYHFIALNAHDQLHADPRWGDIFLARISAEQQKWLRSDLERNRNSRGIVVFLHQPLWYNWGSWMPIHSMLREYPVAAVIAGHFHYDQDDGFLDQIRYVIVGAAGGNVKRTNRDGGTTHHVTVMTLEGRKADFRLIPVDGSPELSFTPRQDMDRVQALEQMLGELYNFKKHNALCVSEGRLQRPDKQPARLNLIPIGNPIDVPVELTIKLEGDQFLLEEPAFGKEECAPQSPASACILKPSSRIESSNTSSIVLNDRFGPLAPIWSAGVSVRPGAKVSPGDKLNLSVRIAFEGLQAQHAISATATAEITACTAATRP